MPEASDSIFWRSVQPQRVINVSPLPLCCNTLLTKKECNKVIITLTLRRSCRRRHVYATIQLVKNPTSDPTDSNEFFLLSLCKTSQEAATATAARVRVLWYFGVPRLVCLGYSLSIASEKGLRPLWKRAYEVYVALSVAVHWRPLSRHVRNPFRVPKQKLSIFCDMTLRLSKVASVGKGAIKHGALPVESGVTKPSVIRNHCFRAVIGGTPCVCHIYKQGQYAVRIRFSSVCGCGAALKQTIQSLSVVFCWVAAITFRCPLPSARVCSCKAIRMRCWRVDVTVV